ncbi:GerAB/ArcD/ProY family transporter [Paenibacillus sp. MMS20-IR301]|uniref:GerAB/ArcD/ProY family transporter n=1 Tax=Paenibacillus sp. MMS20-IR301 TaxID=2895946 RepID=UPI0028E60280|nr:GerAB/ArcD/ProY family transporter [Paenibacillus sp. MMS20-IR301]WNS45456.1 GerAB/ArcD/ProY family transporter [Paenibacillus sp. MMS20-IR301]
MQTSKWQLTRFAIVYLSGQSTMFLAPGIIEASGYQGWIGIIAGCALAMIPLFFTVQVGRMRPGTGWIDFGAEIMGKWLHRLMVILLLCWCVYYASYDIENFVLFFGANYLRGTPPLFIQIVIGLVIIYTAQLGVTSIVYMSDGISLIFIFSFILSIYLFVQHANFAMLPAFIHYHDPRLISNDAVTVMSWLSEWVVLLFIVPEFKISKSTMKRLAVAGVAVMLLVLLSWLMTLLNFGVYLSKELKFPYLQLVRSSSNDDLLGNSDPILIGFWSSSMFIHSAFLIFVAGKCAAYLTGQRAKKLLVPALTVCSITIAFLYSRHLAKYDQDYYAFSTVLFWLIVECIPVYYFIVAVIRMKLGKQGLQGRGK